jgi:hypothetical protein
VEAQVVALRLAERRGPAWIAARLGMHASTVGRVLRRYQVPPLRDLDPLTGAVLRRRASDRRYEHDRPGRLIHLAIIAENAVALGGRFSINARGIPSSRHLEGGWRPQLTVGLKGLFAVDGVAGVEVVGASVTG